MVLVECGRLSGPGSVRVNLTVSGAVTTGLSRLVPWGVTLLTGQEVYVSDSTSHALAGGPVVSVAASVQGVSNVHGGDSVRTTLVVNNSGSVADLITLSVRVSGFLSVSGVSCGSPCNGGLTFGLNVSDVSLANIVVSGLGAGAWTTVYVDATVLPSLRPSGAVLWATASGMVESLASVDASSGMMLSMGSPVSRSVTLGPVTAYSNSTFGTALAPVVGFDVQPVANGSSAAVLGFGDAPVMGASISWSGLTTTVQTGVFVTASTTNASLLMNAVNASVGINASTSGSFRQRTVPSVVPGSGGRLMGVAVSGSNATLTVCVVVWTVGNSNNGTVMIGSTFDFGEIEASGGMVVRAWAGVETSASFLVENGTILVSGNTSVEGLLVGSGAARYIVPRPVPTLRCTSCGE